MFVRGELTYGLGHLEDKRVERWFIAKLYEAQKMAHYSKKISIVCKGP